MARQQASLALAAALRRPFGAEAGGRASSPFSSAPISTPALALSAAASGLHSSSSSSPGGGGAFAAPTTTTIGAATVAAAAAGAGAAPSAVAAAAAWRRGGETSAARPRRRPPTGPSMLLRGITFDAVGVLIEPRERVGDAYFRALREHDAPACAATSPHEISARYRRAYNKPALYAGGASSTRFHDAFWRGIVAASTGSSSPQVFDHLYAHYAQPGAWRVLPGAVGALRRLRAAGLKTAVLSNNDARLRPLLDGLGLGSLFDAVVVSAEEGAEKPSPVIFERALAALGLGASQVVHVGDDRLLDVWGARDAGLLALLMGEGGGCDVRSLDALADRLLRHHHHHHHHQPHEGGGGGVPFYFMHDHEEEEEEEQEEDQEGVC